MDRAAFEQIARALAHVPSGCGVLTADAPAGRSGMLASFIQQAGFDPPAVSVAVKKGRPIEPLIDAAGRFALNLLGEDPAPLFRHFAGGFGPGEDAFAGLKTIAVEGCVGLADAIAVLCCRVAGKHDAGDHWLYVGHVIWASARDDARPYVHIRRNGMTY